MLPVSDEVKTLLESASPMFDFGTDLLDTGDKFVADVSVDVESWVVTRQMYADIHGGLEIQTRRDFDWGRDRLRPWITVSDGILTQRFDLGVFVPLFPDSEESGETPPGRQVTAVDKLWYLQREIGDTYVAESGTLLLDAGRGVLSSAGVTGDLLLAGDRGATALDGPMVWALSSTPATYLRAANDLFSRVNYRGIWVDEAGRFRSEPYLPPSVRPPGWTFEVENTLTTVVEESGRRLSGQSLEQPNYWRVVNTATSSEPTEANGGVYVVDRTAGLEPWEIRRKTVFVEAADAAALEAAANRIVSEDTQLERVLAFRTSPLPIASHFDVAMITDTALGVSAKCQARRWSLSSDMSMDWEWEVL